MSRKEYVVFLIVELIKVNKQVLDMLISFLESLIIFCDCKDKFFSLLRDFWFI